MTFQKLLQLLLILLFSHVVAGASIPCPDPDCGTMVLWPSEVLVEPPLGVTGNQSFDGTVVAGQMYRFSFVSGCMSDFPAPGRTWWNISWQDDTIEAAVLEVQIPADSLEPVAIYGFIGGGITAECTRYYGDKLFNLLIEGQPTPTPSPIPPSPTPIWSPGPCPPPCAPMILNPLIWSENNPLTLIIEHTGTPGSFTGLVEYGGPVHPTTEVGPNQYLAENLKPGGFYIWSFTHTEPCLNSEQWCTSYFSTIDATPTPTPEPTTTPTITVSPSPSTTPTLSPSPTPAPRGWGEVMIIGALSKGAPPAAITIAKPIVWREEQ